MGALEGRKIAVIVTDGFEEAEFTKPVEALRNEGATVDVIAPDANAVQAFEHLEKTQVVQADRLINEVKPDDYDALVIPGGVANADRLRLKPEVVEFARAMVQAGKPAGVICHGPWVLVEAGVVSGRKLTSWPSLKTDIENAGGEWVDEEVVVDGGLVTSRKPADLPAFCA